jgi:hypothetical protein
MKPRRKPPAPAWPGRWSIAVAVGGLVAVALVWWHSARTPLEAASTRVAPPPVARAARVSEPAAPTIDPTHTVGPRHDDPLTAYKKANVYPPTSRPLSKDQLDLLQPNHRYEAMRLVDRDAHVRFLFTADRYFLLGDDTLTATLAVERDGKPIAVRITQAYASVVDPVSHQEARVPVAYAPGAPLTAVFAPSQLPLKRQAAITMAIEFDYATGKQAAHFDVQYTPTTGIPARFTGAFTDAVERGSLVVHAGVAVTSPGHYVIDANLFDADDQPIAWARWKGDLEAGTQDAALAFFGKVLVDATAHGPFHIGQLRGAHYVPGMDPDLEQMPSFPGTYTTQAYPTEQFSDAEYDSPQKQRMIRLLSSQDHNDGAGHGMPGGESGGETRGDGE